MMRSNASLHTKSHWIWPISIRKRNYNTNNEQFTRCVQCVCRRHVWTTLDGSIRTDMVLFPRCPLLFLHHVRVFVCVCRSAFGVNMWAIAPDIQKARLIRYKPRRKSQRGGETEKSLDRNDYGKIMPFNLCAINASGERRASERGERGERKTKTNGF